MSRQARLVSSTLQYMGTHPQTVLITGANRGLGLGLSRHYLARGRHVLAACRDPEKFPAQAAGASGSLRVLPLDLEDPAFASWLADQVREDGRSLDLVINNAAICKEEALGQWTGSAFTASFVVNAVGPALLVQAIREALTDGAKIIQLSSGLGSIAHIPRSPDVYTSYAMSKAALNMLTARLAVELADRNIVVCAMNPGWVRTDMGGPDAPETVDSAVEKLTSTIERLGPADSGKVLSAEGIPLAW